MRHPRYGYFVGDFGEIYSIDHGRKHDEFYVFDGCRLCGDKAEFLWTHIEGPWTPVGGLVQMTIDKFLKTLDLHEKEARRNAGTT